jgi:hypothetical protein
MRYEAGERSDISWQTPTAAAALFVDFHSDGWIGGGVPKSNSSSCRKQTNCAQQPKQQQRKQDGRLFIFICVSVSARALILSRTRHNVCTF